MGLEKSELTANQLILLLEVYRGTQEEAQVMGTSKEDIRKLTGLGLINPEGDIKGEIIVKAIKVTEYGHIYINTILAICPKEEGNCDNEKDLSIHAAYPSHFR